jgi:hypothetical protein
MHVAHARTQVYAYIHIRMSMHMYACVRTHIHTHVHKGTCHLPRSRLCLLCFDFFLALGSFLRGSLPSARQKKVIFNQPSERQLKCFSFFHSNLRVMLVLCVGHTYRGEVWACEGLGGILFVSRDALLLRNAWFHHGDHHHDGSSVVAVCPS